MSSRLVTDLKEMQALAERLWDENMRFREHLKFRLHCSDERVDELAREVYREVAAEVDCLACANCCKAMGCALTRADIERLSRRLGMTDPEFERRYVTREQFGEKMIDTKPCPFLEGNLCTVYEDRPEDCRGFPHLDKDDFRQRSRMMVENTSSCPIVFNTLERLKPRLGFRSRRRR